MAVAVPTAARPHAEDALAPGGAPAEAAAPLSLGGFQAGPEPDDALALGGLSARKAALLAGTALLLVVSLVLLAPAFADMSATWERLRDGSHGWLALALVFAVLSFAGHVILFAGVAGRGGRSRIGLRAGLQINLAANAATRLFATAGAGGIALTAWAMRRTGMERADVAARLVAFHVLLYGVYMAVLLLGGLGLYTGVLPGGGSFAITVVPAILGGSTIALVAAAQLIPPGAGRVRRFAAPVARGVRDARELLRSGNPAVLGALMWWGFQIAVLWACFEAFGHAPPATVLAVAFFVGMLANLLPLPGGVGGVDGGMVGALIAFGVEPELALLAVLGYRGFVFWLPIVPGAIAYLTLRRTVARWGREDAGEPAVPSGAWKASVVSSTIRISSAVCRRWPSRCKGPRPSLGPTTPSSSPST